MDKIIFCDVCDTLFDSNTTFDFIKFTLDRKDKGKRFIFDLLTSRYSPFFYFLIILGKLLKRDIVRPICISLLAEMSHDELDAMSRDFFLHFLQAKKNVTVDALLSRLRSDAALYFASSSVEPVIKTVAKAYEAKYFSSELLFDQKGNFLGKLKSDLTGKKHEKVLELAKRFQPEDIIVITDNFTDKKLVAMAGQRYVVVKKESDKDFWKDLDPEFVYV